MGSQAWIDGRTKTNVAPKNIHTLFFLVVGDSISKADESVFDDWDYSSVSYQLYRPRLAFEVLEFTMPIFI